MIADRLVIAPETLVASVRLSGDVLGTVVPAEEVSWKRAPLAVIVKGIVEYLTASRSFWRLVISCETAWLYVSH